MKKYLLLPLLLVFLYLICFPGPSISAARDGLSLWYRSIIPVLFPFMFLCRLMIHCNLIQYIPRCLTRPIRFLLGCTHEGALSVLIGFLCGFPTGACFASDLYHTGKISKSESQFLIPFVNNLSPGFLSSYLAVEQLQDPKLRIPAICIPFASAFLYGILTSISYRKTLNLHAEPIAQQMHDRQMPYPENLFLLLDDAISVSVTNTMKLGGYIIFFSILSDAVTLLPVTHPLLLTAASSIEVTKGLHLVCHTDLPVRIRQIFAIALASFGGWSAAFQTAGVTGMNAGAFLQYIKSRVLITLLSILLSFMFFS